MPEMTATVTTTTAVPAATDVQLVTGGLRREKGRAILTLDCSNLHNYLDTLGVQREDGYKRFANAPASRMDILDNVNHAIVPKALCSFDYKKDANGAVMPGVLEFDLLKQYTTPPTEQTLQQLAESVRDAAIAVVTHYQPVEISITVVGKKPR